MSFLGKIVKNVRIFFFTNVRYKILNRTIMTFVLKLSMWQKNSKPSTWTQFVFHQPTLVPLSLVE